MSDGEITSLRIRIEGAVQGVGFRAFAVAHARQLALDGWVRNRSDGSVEALVSGETKQVERFVEACMRGPEGARVAHVDLHNTEPPAEKGFRQRSTV
jgi:acylphosphatase